MMETCRRDQVSLRVVIRAWFMDADMSARACSAAA